MAFRHDTMIDTYPVELAHACSWEPSTDTRKPWRFLPKLGGGKADALAAARADAEAARGAAHGAAARAAASDAAAADAAGRLAMLQVKHELLIDMWTLRVLDNECMGGWQER